MVTGSSQRWSGRVVVGPPAEVGAGGGGLGAGDWWPMGRGSPELLRCLRRWQEHQHPAPTLPAAADLPSPQPPAPSPCSAAATARREIGSASCRESVCQYVSFSVFADILKKTNITLHI